MQNDKRRNRGNLYYNITFIFLPVCFDTFSFDDKDVSGDTSRKETFQTNSIHFSERHGLCSLKIV